MGPGKAVPRPAPRRRLFGSPRIRPADVRGAFREPCAQAPTFVAAIEAMLRAERQPGFRTYFYTFTTACSGSHERLLEDVRRQFNILQQSRAWRRLADAIWVIADDRREDPHVHLVALLPPGLPRSALRSAWKGGISNAKRVTGTPARLGAYLGIQWDRQARNPRSRRRKWGRKRRQSEGLACTPSPATPPSINQGLADLHPSLDGAEGRASRCAPPCATLAAPGGPWRAGAGGDAGAAIATTGAATVTRTRRRGSAGERPQAEGHTTTAAGGARVDQASPPRGSEPSP